MRHRISGRKFHRNTGQRKALLLGLAKALIEHEQILTTTPKAKDLRPVVEKLITFGKEPTLAHRRVLLSRLGGDNRLVSKILDVLAPRYANRNGGYLRVLKCGFRHGDAAPMSVIEFVDRPSANRTAKQPEAAVKTPAPAAPAAE